MVIDPESLVLRNIQELAPEDLQGFSCGRAELENFLFDDARDYHAHGITSTTLVFLGSETAPVAYFSLSADSVRLTETEKFELGLPFMAPISYYPAVKLTKLAVASKYQTSGLGSYLLTLIYGMVVDSFFAVRLITVDAVNTEKVRAFYERNGFIRSGADERERKQQRQLNTILMIKDIYQA